MDLINALIFVLLNQGTGAACDFQLDQYGGGTCVLVFHSEDVPYSWDIARFGSLKIVGLD